MQKKHLIFLLAAFAAVPVLAKPVVVKEAQLLGKWQCVAADETPMTFTFGSEQKLGMTVDINIPSSNDETLSYRNFADGTWTLNGGKIGLTFKTTDVQRQHSTAKIRTAEWREADKETFTRMRNHIGNPGKLQMQVKKIGNKSLNVRMQGDSQDIVCRKV